MTRVLTLILGIALGATSVFVYQSFKQTRTPKPQYILRGSAAPITEIVLQRQVCLQDSRSCPSYVVHLYRDGTATYDGEEYSKFAGDNHGKISAQNFERLAQLIESQDFFDLADVYKPDRKLGEDDSLVIIVVTRGGADKKVEDYSDTSPFKFWLIEQAVEGVASRIDWQAKK